MSLFEKLVAFYETVEWPMVQVPNETILSTTYNGDNGQWVFVSSSDEAHEAIAMFSRAPDPCPPDRLPDVLRFFNRANFGMTIGAWAVDQADGEIRFRVGMDLHDIELTEDMLRRLTSYTVLTMDHYLPALQGLLQGVFTPDEAFAVAFPNRAAQG